MKCRKRILTWAIAIGIVAGTVLVLRIPSWVRTFGLSREVIAGEVEVSAEDTIRLYLYYKNHSDPQNAYRFLTNDLRQFYESLDQSNAALDGGVSVVPAAVQNTLNRIFRTDITLVELEPLESEPNETRKHFHVVYNVGTLWVPSWTNEDTTVDVVFDLMRVRGDGNSPWRIYAIGNG